MNFYVPFALFFILLCFVKRKNAKSSSRVFVATMAWAFIFAAIRYQFGPDWFSYYDVFQDLQQIGADAYLDYRDHNEALFIRYFSLFSSYTLFLAINSLFWFGSYIIFFRRYVNSRYYWFVLLMLFFDTNCILNNLVAMRQAITSYLFIFAFLLLIKYRDKLKGKLLFGGIIMFCSLVHTSCFALLPLVFLDTKEKSIFFSNRYTHVVIGLSLVSLFIGRYAVLEYVVKLMIQNVEDFQRYETYLHAFKGDSVSVAALLKYAVLIILNIIPLFFIIKQGAKENDPTHILVFKLGIVIATIGCVLGQGLMSRYMMILNPFYIAAVVRACTLSRNKNLNAVVLVCISFVSVYSFYFYLQADYCVSFLTYQSVFSAPFIP